MWCWDQPLLNYELCCVGLFPVVDHAACLRHTTCCALPDPSQNPPRTFSHRVLRLGQAPQGMAEVAAGLSAEIGLAERRWRTSGDIDVYRRECLEFAQNDSLVRTFRSFGGQRRFTHPTLMFATMVITPWWQISTTLNSVLQHAGARAILGTQDSLAESFDRLGSPDKLRLEVRGMPIMLSFEYLTTLQMVLAILDSVRLPFGGAVDGQAADGHAGGLPRPEQLANPHLRLPWNIVEVGAGWGFLALLTQLLLKVNSYSIVDLPEAQFLQYRVLEQVRPSTAFLSTNLSSEDVLPRYDLFISNWAFTELDDELRGRYFNRLIVRSRRGFIVDNSFAMRYRRDARSEYEDMSGTTGFHLVGRLQRVGFKVRIQTLDECLRLPFTPDRGGVTVVISWVNTSEPLGPNFDYVVRFDDLPQLDRLYDDHLNV